MNAVLNALMADYPSQLYWYDKVVGTSYSLLGLATIDGEPSAVVVMDELNFAMSVSTAYAGNESYTVNAAKVQTAQTAIQNAQTIVSTTSGTVMERLSAYKDAICTRTSYDNGALAAGTPYGDPWQLVNVFDNDPETNVVCEGYSKAFKFLFDLSDFGDSYDCILATGTMRGGTGAGAHMWNVVRMDDGRNFLVDVTNCDTGTVGAPDKLFMAYGPDGVWSDEYSFTVDDDDTIYYRYDNDTKNTFDEAHLTIASTAYDGNANQATPHNVIFTWGDGENNRAVYSYANNGSNYLVRDGQFQFVIPEDLHPYSDLSDNEKVAWRYQDNENSPYFYVGGYIPLMDNCDIILVPEKTTTHAITVSDGIQNGTVTIDNGQNAAAVGEEIHFTAKPSENYTLNGFPEVTWTDDQQVPHAVEVRYDSEDEQGIHYYFSMPGAPVTVCASFAQGGGPGPGGNLMVSTNNSFGSLTVEVRTNGSWVRQEPDENGNYNIEPHANVKVTATLNGGTLNSFSIYGAYSWYYYPTGNADMSHSFEMPDGNVYVNAQFTPPASAVVVTRNGIDNYNGGTVSAKVGENGAPVDMPAGVGQIILNANSGETIFVTVTTNEGYCLLPGGIDVFKDKEGFVYDQFDEPIQGTHTFSFSKGDGYADVHVLFALPEPPAVKLIQRNGEANKTYTKTDNATLFGYEQGDHTFTFPSYNPFGEQLTQGNKVVFRPEYGNEVFAAGNKTHIFGNGIVNYYAELADVYEVNSCVTHNGEITLSADSAAEGETVEFYIKADSGFTAQNVHVEFGEGQSLVPYYQGQSSEDNSKSIYSFTMPGTSVTVYADFVESPGPGPSIGGNLFVSTENGSFGFLTVQVQEGGTYVTRQPVNGWSYNINPGENVRVIATPVNGGTLHSGSFSVSGAVQRTFDLNGNREYNTPQSLDFTMPQSGLVYLYARFTTPDTAVIFSINGNPSQSRGTVSAKVGENGDPVDMPAGVGQIILNANSGETIFVTATPSEGYCLLSGGISAYHEATDSTDYFDPNTNQSYTDMQAFTFEKSEGPVRVNVGFASTTAPTVTLNGPENFTQTYTVESNPLGITRALGEYRFTLPTTLSTIDTLGEKQKVRYHGSNGMPDYDGGATVGLGRDPFDYTFEAELVDCATITLNQPGNGTMTASTTLIGPNETMELTVTPDEGCEVRSVSATYDGGMLQLNEHTGGAMWPVQQYSMTMPSPLPTDNVSITAEIISPYNIVRNVFVDGSNPSDGEDDWGFIDGPDKALAGREVGLRVAPRTGYALTGIQITYGENQTVDYEYEYNSYVFNMPDSDVTFTATFVSVEDDEPMPEGAVRIDKVTFPDDEFRDFIANYFHRKEGDILTQFELQKVHKLDLHEVDDFGRVIDGEIPIGVKDLTGINFFSELTDLNVGGNDIRSIDLSKTPKLRWLWCYNCNLSTLNLGPVAGILEYMNCSDNDLDELNISACSELKWLECFGNRITWLDLSGNANMELLRCQRNRLGRLDLRNCLKLSALEPVQNPEIDEDDVLCFGAYKDEYLDSTQYYLIVDEDVALIRSDADMHTLTVSFADGSVGDAEVDVRPCEWDDVNNRPVEPYEMATNEWVTVTVRPDDGSLVQNVEIACDDPNTVVDWSFGNNRYSFHMPNDNVTVTVTLAALDANNTDGLTLISPQNFPDDALRDYVARFYGKNQAEDDAVKTAANSLTAYERGLMTRMELFQIDKNGNYEYNDRNERIPLGVGDLTGIALFTNLKELDCSGGKLQKVDLSNNTALEKVFVDDNDIEELTLDNLSKLEILCVQYNRIESLDVSRCTALRWLDCSNNDLEALSLTGLGALDVLSCEGNDIPSLDLSGSNLSSLNLDAPEPGYDEGARVRGFGRLLKEEDGKAYHLTVDDATAVYNGDNAFHTVTVTPNEHAEIEVYPAEDDAQGNVTHRAVPRQWVTVVVRPHKNYRLQDVTARLTGVEDESGLIDTLYQYGRFSFRMPDDDVTVSATVYTPGENDTLYRIDGETFPDEDFREYIQRLFGLKEGDCLTQYDVDRIRSMELYEIDERGHYCYDEDGNRRGLGIEDLGGIELFKNLETLDCCGNKLYDLDLSQNTNLLYLYVDDNNLERLNLEGCTELLELSCRENDLPALDVSDCENLEFLNCQRNRLTELDVSDCENLEWLACCSNELTMLDVAHNANLEWLELRDNQVRTIKVAGLTRLSKLNTEYNRLRELDIRGCTSLMDIDFDDPEPPYDRDADVRYFSELDPDDPNYNDEEDQQHLNYRLSIDDDVALIAGDNNLHTLRVAQEGDGTVSVNGTAVVAPDAADGIAAREWVTVTLQPGDGKIVTGFQAWRGVPADKQKEGFDAEDDAVSIDWFYDYNQYRFRMPDKDVTVWAQFETPDANAEGNVIINGENFPDDAFREFICNFFGKKNDGTDVLTEYERNLAGSFELFQTDENFDIICDENGDWVPLGVTDLTGIAHFPYLSNLNVGGNKLTSLDVSQNTKLEYLWVAGNGLATLTLTGCTDLRELGCEDNELTALDVSGCTDLEFLNCSENRLTTLNLDSNTELEDLDCSDNCLSALDVSHNTRLERLHCEENLLSALDLTKCTELLRRIDINNPQPPYNEEAEVRSFGRFENDEGDEDFWLCVDDGVGLRPARALYTVNKLVDNAANHGAIDVNIQPDAQDGNKLKAAEHQKVTVTLEPNAGCVVSDFNVWTGEGASSETVSWDFANNAYSFTMPSSDVTVYAAFATTPTQGTVVINKTNFDDDAFRAYICRTFGKQEGDVLTAYDLGALTDIRLFAVDNYGRIRYDEKHERIPLGVASLKGIGHFTNVHVLDATGNNLTALDLSQNTTIEYLSVDNNKLATLTLTGCNKLVYADCSNNRLTTLKAPAGMECLECYGNRLTTLDVSACENLQRLNCEKNRLNLLDITNCTKLRGNIDLDDPEPGFDEDSDFRGYKRYTTPWGDEVYALSVDDSVGIIPTPSYDIHTEINGGLTTGCSIVVDTDAVRGEAVPFTLVCGEGAMVSGIDVRDSDNEHVDCWLENGSYYVRMPAREVTIRAWFDPVEADELVAINNKNFPDDTFREYVAGMLGKNDGDSMTRFECESVSYLELYTFNASGDRVPYEIETLEGIEFFPNLRFLYASGCGIETIDLSENKELEYLWLDKNNITTIDLSALRNLRMLGIRENALTELNLRYNERLEWVDCCDNDITTLTLENKPCLQHLFCDTNQITTLEIGGCMHWFRRDVRLSERKVDDKYAYYGRTDFDDDEWRLICDKGVEISDEAMHEINIDPGIRCATLTADHDFATKDTVVTIRVDLETGYELGNTLSVSLNDGTETPVTINATGEAGVYTFTMPDNNVYVTAAPVPVDPDALHDINVTPNAQGTVVLQDADDATITTSKAGGKVLVTVTPAGTENDPLFVRDISVTAADDSAVAYRPFDRDLDDGSVTFCFDMPAQDVTIEPTFWDYDNVPRYCVPIDDWNFPDDDFRAYVLRNLDKNFDSLLSDDEVEEIREIDLPPLKNYDEDDTPVTTLKGIERLYALENLDLGENRVAALDVSGMDNLETLDCVGAGLTTLNIDGCRALRDLDICYNNLTGLRITRCQPMRQLVETSSYSEDNSDPQQPIREYNKDGRRLRYDADTALLPCTLTIVISDEGVTGTMTAMVEGEPTGEATVDGTVVPVATAGDIVALVPGDAAYRATAVTLAYNETTETLNPDDEGIYSFIMPNAPVTVTATLKSVPTVTAPAPVADLTYNGHAQALVTAGTTDVGTLEYSLDGQNWSTTPPTGTDAGDYTVRYRVQGNENYADLTGTITASIAVRPVTVTITGNTQTVTYDGQPHTVEGYTAIADPPLYNTGDITNNGTASATRTDVGKTFMGLTAEQFANTNDNFTVTFSVTDGWMKITGQNNLHVDVENAYFGDVSFFVNNEEVPVDADGGCYVDPGTAVTIKATPKKGGSLHSRSITVSGNGVYNSFDPNNNNDYTTAKTMSFNMPQLGDAYVRVSFTPSANGVSIHNNDPGLGTVTVTLNGTTVGTVTDSKGIAFEAEKDDAITITATPNSNYAVPSRGMYVMVGPYASNHSGPNGNTYTYFDADGSRVYTEPQTMTFIKGGDKAEAYAGFVKVTPPTVTLTGDAQSKTYTMAQNSSLFKLSGNAWVFIIPDDFNPYGTIQAGKKLVFYSANDAGHHTPYGVGQVVRLSNYQESETFQADLVDGCAIEIPTFEHGSITASTTCALPNEQVFLTVMPSEGYGIKSNNVTATYEGGSIPVSFNYQNGPNSYQYAFTVPGSLSPQKITVSAEFEKLPLYINAYSYEDEDRPGRYLKITPTVNGERKYQAEKDQTVTLTVEKGEKTVFNGLEVYTNHSTPEWHTERVNFTQVNATTYTFVMPDLSVYVDADFGFIGDHTITFNGNGHGTVREQVRGCAGPFTENTADEGNTIKLFFEPDEGYRLKSYTVMYGNNSVEVDRQNDTFVMPADNVTVNAEFEELGIEINAANFPDEAFRTFISSYDTDGDQRLSGAELNAVKSITLPAGSTIASLEGITQFYALESLNLNGVGTISTLDVSGLEHLATLNAAGAALTGLTVDGCEALTNLNIIGNSLTSVDLTDCARLLTIFNAENLDNTTDPDHPVYSGNGCTLVSDAATKLIFMVSMATAVTNNGVQGTLTASVGNETVQQKACVGDTVVLTPSGEAGSVVTVKLARGGEEVTLQPVGEVYSFTMPNVPVTATATFKRVPNVTGLAPVANLTYNGRAQALVTAGTTSGGTLEYSLDGQNWSGDVPTATNVGSYAVRYRVLGNAAYTDLAEQTATVSIAALPVTVTVTGNTQTATYDGQAHTATGYTATANQTLYSTDDITFSGTASAERTNAGTTPMGLKLSDFTNKNANFNVTFDVTDGSVTINPLAVTVTVTGDTQTATYDGQAHAATGYTATANQTLYSTDDIVFSGTASATRIDAGTTSMGLAAGQFANKNANFNVTFNVTDDGWVKVDQCALTVTAYPKSKTYDNDSATDPELTWRVDNLPEGINSGDVLEGALTREPGQDVRRNADGAIIGYAIQHDGIKLKEGAARQNYTLAFSETPVYFTITPRPLNITANDQESTYGGIPGTLELTYTNDQLATGDTLTGTLRCDVNSGADAGKYSITQGSLKVMRGETDVSGNYTLLYTGAKLTVDKKALTVTAKAKSKDYGDADPTLDLEYTGLVDGDTLSGSLTRVPGEKVGEYAITADSLTVTRGERSVLNNYALTFNDAKLTINPKALTVTPATGQSKTYGDADPTLGYTITAGKLVGGDALTGALARAEGENVGEYAITQGNLTAGDNYTLTVTDGEKFTINKKQLTITPATLTKTYGDADPALTYTVDGLAEGDALTLTLTRENADNQNTGVYAINASDVLVKHGDTNVTANYDVSVASATLTIAQKNVTVVADAKAKKVGEEDPELTYTVTGLVGEDKLGGTLERVAGETVGTYAITQGTLTGGTNYNIARFTDGVLTITAKPVLTVTAQPASKVYGVNDPTFDYTVTGLAEGDTAETVLTGKLGREAGENVGSYAITLGDLAAERYDLNLVSANLTITPAALTVTPRAGQNKTYGDADPTLTYDVNGLVGTDTLTGALARAEGEDAGTYAITQGTLSAGDNYTLTFTDNVNFTVNKKALTVTPKAGQSKTYGEADATLTYDVDGLVGTDKLTGALARAEGEDAGTYAITQSTLSAGDNYTLTFTDGVKFTVNKKALTVTPKAGQSKTYGENDPTLTYTVTGLVKGDTAASVLTGALARATGDDAGEYAITQGDLSAGNNYTLSVTEDVKFTVKKAKLYVVAVPKKKTYGAANEELTYTAIVPTAPQTDAESLLEGELTRETGENVRRSANGTIIGYAIQQGGLKIKDEYAKNYELIFKGARLTINPKALTVTPTAGQGKTYGEKGENGAADPEALTYTVTGLNDDMVASVLTGALARAEGENAGTYAINQGTLALKEEVANNYTLAFSNEPVNYTISPKELTVTVKNQTKVYGDADPALTYTVAPEADTDKVTGTLTRATGEDAGNYVITDNLSTDANHTLNIVTENANNAPATLTITPRPLTVIADAKAKASNGEEPTLTYTVTGLVNGDTVGAVLTGALTRAPGENAGAYAITQDTLRTTTDNYTIKNFVPAQLTISQDILIVKAVSSSKEYGKDYPELSYTVTYSNGSDASAAGLLTGALEREEGEDVGVYAIKQGGLKVVEAYKEQYAIDFTGENLTITPKALTVTAKDATKTYGDADPKLTYTVDGLANGDEKEDVLTGALSRAVGKDVGEYEINKGTLKLTSGNYTLDDGDFTGATLTIEPKALTITPTAELSKTYGDADPALTYTVEGLANGDEKEDVLNGALSRRQGEDAGTYPITLGNLSAGGNYTLTLEDADLTINKKDVKLTLKPATCTKVYGEQEHMAYEQPTGLADRDQGMTVTGELTRAAGKNVGKYAISTEALKVGDAYNYNFKIDGDAKFEITQRPVGLTWKDTSLTYNGYSQKPTAEVSTADLLEGDKCTVTVTAVDADDKAISAVNADRYTAKAVALSNPNYKLPDVPDDCKQNFTIGKAVKQNTSFPRTVTVSTSGVVDGKLDLSAELKNVVNCAVDSKGGIVTKARVEKVGEAWILNYDTADAHTAEGTTGTVTIKVWSTNYKGDGSEAYMLSVVFRTSDMFSLSFETNGGTKQMSRRLASDDLIENYLPKPETVERDGYDFDGWYIDAACTTTPVAANTPMGGADRTVYAKWTARTFTVTLDPGEYGTLPVGHSGTITYTVEDNPNDEKLKLPVLADSNVNDVKITFTGWKQITDGDDVEPMIDVTIDPASMLQTTYVAQWKQGEVAGKVSYEAPEGSTSGLKGVDGLVNNEASTDDENAQATSLANAMKAIAGKESDKQTDTSDSKVTVEMKVTGELTNPSAIEAINAEAAEANAAYNDPYYKTQTDFMDISITCKTSLLIPDGNDNTDEVEIGSANVPNAGRVVEIPLQYDLTGRYNISLYRYHVDENGKTDTKPLTRLASRPRTAKDMNDGTFYISGSGRDAIIYLYSQFFSGIGVNSTPDESKSIHMVTLNYKDGSTGDVQAVYVKHGEKIALPKAPTWQGAPDGKFIHRFVRWTCNGVEFNLDSPVNEDGLVLDAEWIKVPIAGITVEGSEVVYDGELHQVTSEVADNASVEIYFSTTEALTADNYKDGKLEAPSSKEPTPGAVDVYWFAVSPDDSCVPMTSDGQSSGKVKLNVKKKNNTMSKTPQAQSTTFTGGTVQLISAGAIDAGMGTVKYALGTNASTPPQSGWSTAIPTASSAGTYYVWYKVEGKGVYADVAPTCLTVTIAAAEAQASTATVTATPQAEPKPTPTIPMFKKKGKTTISAAPGDIYQIDLGGSAGKKYKSSKKKVAIVDQNGLLTVRGAGKTKITVKVGKKTRTLNLTVKDPTIPTKLMITASGPLTGKKGETVQLDVTMLPGDANSAIKWKSSNKKVATVSSTGLVTFKKPGKATITATAVRGKKKAKVKVKVTK